MPLSCHHQNNVDKLLIPLPTPFTLPPSKTHTYTQRTLRILFTSRSSASPATVVMHFRPFRCCTRMCTYGGWFVVRPWMVL